MAWTVYEPRGASATLRRGQASFAKGVLRLHATDVAAAGISGDDVASVVLELDAEGRRIGIRSPAPGEPTVAMRTENRSQARRRLSVSGALARMGIAVEEPPERLRVECTPGRLIVFLSGPAVAKSAAAPAPEAEHTPNPIAERAAKRAQPIGRARPLKETPQP